MIDAQRIACKALLPRITAALDCPPCRQPVPWIKRLMSSPSVDSMQSHRDQFRPASRPEMRRSPPQAGVRLTAKIKQTGNSLDDFIFQCG